jgi:hypothetical protein
MRQPPSQPQAFDLVVNLFTSFGYFSSDGENRLVTQTRRITPNGRYVEKKISASGFERTYMERVRVFEPDHIRCLLQDAELGS